MRLLRDFRSERLRIQARAKNTTAHQAEIFIRALVRSGCSVEKTAFAYEIRCPQGFEFTFTLVHLGRRGGAMLKVFPKGKETFGEKPFFSWVNHGWTDNGRGAYPNQISAKRAATLLTKKIRMNPLYSVMET